MKRYTVNQLAQLANISTRTLRHYDHIGLLQPAFCGDNGYRYYQHQQLALLMQILFYKELDFSLDEIKQIIHNPNFDKFEAFKQQKQILELQALRTQRLIKTVDQILQSMKGNKTMNTHKNYQAFNTDNIDQYKDEVKARWGHTDAYRQSQERYKKWSKQELETIKQEGITITNQLAEVMDKPFDDSQVQKLIAQHHHHINRFYDCSIEMYRGLGEMYFADPRFAKYYEDIKPGLAKFMNVAIDFYCTSLVSNEHQQLM